LGRARAAFARPVHRRPVAGEGAADRPHPHPRHRRAAGARGDRLHPLAATAEARQGAGRGRVAGLGAGAGGAARDAPRRGAGARDAGVLPQGRGRSPHGQRPPRRRRAGGALVAGGMNAASADLVEHTARFCRRLRAEGLPLGPGDTLDATRALGSVELVDREDVRLALRTALVKRLEDSPVFDALFEAFWAGSAPVPRNPPVVPPDAEEDSESRSAASARRRSVQAWQELEELAVPAPSSREALGRQDFATFGEDELRAVTALAR